MTDLDDALAEVRARVLDADRLVGAVAAGRRRGEQPTWRRAELRYVDLKAGRRLQVTTYDATQAHTANHAPGPDAVAAVDALLDEPFGNWRVETTAEVLQLRVTKKGAASVHLDARDGAAPPERRHDRDKPRLIAEDDPLLVALGISTAEGRVKASRRDKYHQVEELVRLLDATVSEALAKGHLRTPSTDQPLRVADLGCGNAYLTFAAHRLLAGLRGLPVTLVGVDTKEQSRRHNEQVANRLGLSADQARFVVGSIEEVELDPAPDVVLALHACDTATDDALARAVTWGAPVILAAPCCHHDLAAQLRARPESASSLLTRDGILRERFADTLTDALRSALLRDTGYRVDVVEFVDSAHTPRNTLIRAVRTGGRSPAAREEFETMVGEWGVRPRLADLLGGHR
ncbi:SAM-dependent methyltransferase [Nocardioides sp.]|uniref:class I SAM-dependent methyltransferase n=1 Tax=Nocardioides sp. TaxID=35761 RepID=UPI0035286DE3